MFFVMYFLSDWLIFLYFDFVFFWNKIFFLDNDWRMKDWLCELIFWLCIKMLFVRFLFWLMVENCRDFFLKLFLVLIYRYCCKKILCMCLWLFFVVKWGGNWLWLFVILILVFGLRLFCVLFLYLCLFLVVKWRGICWKLFCVLGLFLCCIKNFFIFWFLF